jgi:RNA polymerase sigma-70 factor (ECF subfamily)
MLYFEVVDKVRNRVLYRLINMKESTTKTFKEVYVSESDAIFRFCLVRVSSKDQALDLTQETFLRLWQSISAGQEIKNNRAYLFTVAHRLIIDWYRKKKSMSLDKIMDMMKEHEPEYEIVGETAEKVGAGIEARYLLSKVNDLTPGYRDPVYLRFVEDLSPGEIGSILGISSNAASVRINRGLAELRKKADYNKKEK